MYKYYYIVSTTMSMSCKGRQAGIHLHIPDEICSIINASEKNVRKFHMENLSHQKPNWRQRSHVTKYTKLIPETSMCVDICLRFCCGCVQFGIECVERESVAEKIKNNNLKKYIKRIRFLWPPLIYDSHDKRRKENKKTRHKRRR